MFDKDRIRSLASVVWVPGFRGKLNIRVTIDCALRLYAVFALLALSAGPVYAAVVSSGNEVTAYESNWFTLGVGFGIVEFDTNVKVSNKITGGSRYIDLEGNLGLPEDDQVNTIYGAYRFNDRHSLVFGYFEIDRDSSVLDFDANYDDIIIIKADISIEDNSRFYNVGYGYNLFRDDRSNITLVAGINSLDLKLKVEASGDLTVDGVTRSEVNITDANVLAPLPLFGLNFGFGFTPKWSIATKITLVGGSYQDVSANVLQTSINSLYKFSDRTGLLLGITYFDADVEIDDDDEVTDISYGYNGAFIGLHVSM